MGVRPENVLVIGDRDDTDGRGAFNAGMRFLCLETGRRRYFKLDPYRNYPELKEREAGTFLPMYSASWDKLVDLYHNFF
jgi:FMN phosphatase YigB (HAD superfamily)